MTGSVLLALSYGLLAVFVVAFVVRSVGLARLPVHLRWELAPVPKEKGRGRYGGSYLEAYEWWKQPREESLAGELAYMGKEIFLLKALWEHNRRLWWFSYPFHVGLYLLVAGVAVAVLAGLLPLVGVAPAEWGVVRSGLPVVAGVGSVLGAFGALGLLVSRVASGALRPMTSRVTYFNLVLLLALFVTGLVAVLRVPDFAGRTAAYVGSLAVADVTVTVPAVLAVHLLVTLVFLAYLPFTQMMHFVAKYFTYHEVRWQDEPLVPGGKLEREVLEQLGQTVTWAGPHVGADGRKTWVDVATEEVAS